MRNLHLTHLMPACTCAIAITGASMALLPARAAARAFRKPTDAPLWPG